MPEPMITECFTDLLRSLRVNGLKPPISIQLANKGEALRIVREVEPAGWPMGSTSCRSAVGDIESGKIQSFLLFGIEFWWRPAPAAIEIQQGLREAA